jgi:hypothetical protein
MQMILTLLLFFKSMLAWGQPAEMIHSVRYPQAAGEPHLIKLQDGRVLRSDAAAAAQAEMQLGRRSQSKSLHFFPAPGSFNPTVILGDDAAVRLFNNLNRGYKQDRVTQCYNRAHVWAYEEFKKSGLHSQKSFIFFSDDFILKNNFEWWFHVAPTILVDVEGDLQHQVLDHQFAQRPLNLREWTGLWVKDRHCPFINKYSHYSGAMKNEDCYLMNVPMFIWQPKDIEDFERTGIPKTQFTQWEVQHAYQEAFTP